MWQWLMALERKENDHDYKITSTPCVKPLLYNIMHMSHIANYHKDRKKKKKLYTFTKDDTNIPFTQLQTDKYQKI